jgi:hypothetical protein
LLFHHIKEPIMFTDDVTSTNATKRHHPGLAIIDRDSIYWSKERYRLIPQRTGPLAIQYLVFDSYENEIVGTHKLISQAMAQRDELDPA